jgi:hypothetical protein
MEHEYSSSIWNYPHEMYNHLAYLYYMGFVDTFEFLKPVDVNDEIFTLIIKTHWDGILFHVLRKLAEAGN